jgi:hypothetical protein
VATTARRGAHTLVPGGWAFWNALTGFKPTLRNSGKVVNANALALALGRHDPPQNQPKLFGTKRHHSSGTDDLDDDESGLQ